MVQHSNDNKLIKVAVANHSLTVGKKGTGMRAGVGVWKKVGIGKGGMKDCGNWE